MTLAQALHAGIRRLEDAGASDARVNAGWLLSAITGEQRLMLPMIARTLSEEEDVRYQTMLARMEAGEPLQYVLGVQEFMGRDFKVDARVLIPREDTQTLVSATAQRLTERDARVLDIGTGSGAIAITLALMYPRCAVTAVDISRDAICVAEENARLLNAPVRFIQSDLFVSLAQERFDVIVSNPPYICTREITSLQREVQKEPRAALDGGQDGLTFYRRIIKDARAHLTPGGALLFEVGYDQAAAVCDLLAQSGFKAIGTKWDLNGVERVVYGEN